MGFVGREPARACVFFAPRAGAVLIFLAVLQAQKTETDCANPAAQRAPNDLQGRLPIFYVFLRLYL